MFRKKNKKDDIDVTFSTDYEDSPSGLMYDPNPPSLMISNTLRFKGVVSTRAELDQVEKEPGVVYQVADEDAVYVYAEDSFILISTATTNNDDGIVSSSSVYDAINSTNNNNNGIVWEELD